MPASLAASGQDQLHGKSHAAEPLLCPGDQNQSAASRCRSHLETPPTLARFPRPFILRTQQQQNSSIYLYLFIYKNMPDQSLQYCDFIIHSVPYFSTYIPTVYLQYKMSFDWQISSNLSLLILCSALHFPMVLSIVSLGKQLCVHDLSPQLYQYPKEGAKLNNFYIP